MRATTRQVQNTHAARERRHVPSDEERAEAIIRATNEALHGADFTTLDALVQHARRLHNPAKDGSIVEIDTLERDLARHENATVPYDVRERFGRETEGLSYVRRNREFTRRFNPPALAFEVLFAAYRWHPAHRCAYLACGVHSAATLHRLTLRSFAEGIPGYRVEHLPSDDDGARKRVLQLTAEGFPESLAVFLLHRGVEGEQVRIPSRRAPGYVFAPWIDDAQHATLREAWKRVGSEKSGVSQKPYTFTFPKTHEKISRRLVRQLASDRDTYKQLLGEADEVNRTARTVAKDAVAKLIDEGMRDELQIAHAAACDVRLVRAALKAAKKPGENASRRIQGAPARFAE